MQFRRTTVLVVPVEKKYNPWVISSCRKTTRRVRRSLRDPSEWDLGIPGLGVGTVVSNGNNNGSGNNASGEDAPIRTCHAEEKAARKFESNGWDYGTVMVLSSL